MTAAPGTDIRTELEAALGELQEGELRWAGVSHAERAQILLGVAEAAITHAESWVEAACSVKEIDPASALAGEEWLSGPYSIAMNAATLAHSLERLASGQSPIAGAKVSPCGDDRVAVDVFPSSIWDRLLLSGFSAKVWLQPGVTTAQARAAAGLAQRRPEQTDGTSVVLGAGNITSIAVLDTLYELVANNRVVILKLNPVMDRLLGPTVDVLRPLIDRGVVRVVTGGVDVGSYLVEHAGVGHVHITGSTQSHDAIVFGIGPDGAARKAKGQPRLAKSITSELGGVSPTIVVPGRWSKRDLRFQAEHVATQRLHNGGYNCIATQVVVVSADWADKDAFLEALRGELESAPPRPAYYPGSDQRVEDALAAHPEATACAPGRVLISPLRADDDAPIFTTEYFSPVLAVVEIPGSGPSFLAAAAEFANQRLVGTLGANVIVPPRTRRSLGAAFDTFIASLRYGTIAINAWTAVGYLTAAAPWGGFPGAKPTAVESGVGVVHNALLLADTERTVVEGPFRPFPRSLGTGHASISPRPPWFVRNRTAGHTGRLLVRFLSKPSAAKLPRIFHSALRG